MEQRSDLKFRFGNYGTTPVTLFFPNKGKNWESTILLVPPLGSTGLLRNCQELAEQVSEAKTSLVTCLTFETKALDVQLRLISGAILYLRGQGLQIFTNHRDTAGCVERSDFFRKRKDKVVLCF